MFGLSLGSCGGEAPFTSADARSSTANLAARTDGAFFVEPTNDNALWSQLTAARAPDSPVWRPVVDEGTRVRFAIGRDELVAPDTESGGPRIVYLQHPSDEVSFWNWRRCGHRRSGSTTRPVPTSPTGCRGSRSSPGPRP